MPSLLARVEANANRLPSGDHEAVCTGTWGYANNLFHVRFTAIEENAAKPVWTPKLHRHFVLEVDRVDDESLILRYDADTIARLRRKPREK